MHAGGEQPGRYVRQAFDRHWNPGGIDLETDADRVTELSRVEFTRLRGLLAQFGAGEQTVTEELAPLAIVLEDPVDQRFVATHMFDEARHADFFDRYWEQIVTPEEQRRGITQTAPTDDRWQPGTYADLFDRTADAMNRLLEVDTPEMRARAIAHYHLTAEGILGRTAYEWIEHRYGDAGGGPTLPGLVAGFERIRTDEGRHVGFGVVTAQRLLETGVEPAVVVETIDDLVPLVEDILRRMVTDADGSVPWETVETWIADARDDRLTQVGALSGGQDRV